MYVVKVVAHLVNQVVSVLTSRKGKMRPVFVDSIFRNITAHRYVSLVVRGTAILLVWRCLLYLLNRQGIDVLCIKALLFTPI